MSWLELLPAPGAVQLLTDLIVHPDKERVSHVDWLETALLHRSTQYSEWISFLSRAAVRAALSAIERAGLTHLLEPEMIELTRRASSEEESEEVVPIREWLRAPAAPHVSFRSTLVLFFSRTRTEAFSRVLGAIFYFPRCFPRRRLGHGPNGHSRLGLLGV